VLDHALSIEDARYFAGWTRADYDAAAEWARLCVVRGYEHFGPARVAHLREYEAKALKTPEQIAAEQAEQQRAADERARIAEGYAIEKARADAAAQVQEAQDRAREAEASRRQAEANKREAQREAQRQAQIAARASAAARCRLSDDYHIFQAQQRLRADIDRKDRLDIVIARERKIEEVSGVQNMTRSYELGAESVRIDEVVENDWNSYRRAGGPSTEKSGLIVLDNPCVETASTRDE
jgi:hypothetical protein